MKAAVVALIIAGLSATGCQDSTDPKTPDAPPPAKNPPGEPPPAAAPAPGTPPGGQSEGSAPAPDIPLLTEDDPNFVPNAGDDAEIPPNSMARPMVAPRQSQDEVKAQEFFEVKGTLEGQCPGGHLRIDVLEVSAERSESEDPGPLTAIEPSGPGAFAIAVPVGNKVELSAICDVNGNGIVEPGTDSISRGEQQVDAATSDYVLKL